VQWYLEEIRGAERLDQGWDAEGFPVTLQAELWAAVQSLQCQV
jgi:hypothetical protein